LTVQIRRAAISTTANLAEGYGRYSYQENSQFCRQSRASAYEVRDQLTTALDQGYISQIAWKDADNLARRVIQVLNGYIRATQRRRQETEDT
jgi:four helix bundle protein